MQVKVFFTKQALSAQSRHVRLEATEWSTSQSLPLTSLPALSANIRLDGQDLADRIDIFNVCDEEKKVL